MSLKKYSQHLNVTPDSWKKITPGKYSCHSKHTPLVGKTPCIWKTKQSSTQKILLTFEK